MTSKRNALIYRGREAGMTLQALATQHQVTKERIRQICVRHDRLLELEQRRNGHANEINDRYEALAVLRSELELLADQTEVVDAKLAALEGISVVPLEDMGFSARAVNALFHENVATLGQLCEKTRAELLRIPNFGKKSLSEVEAELARWGLSLTEY